MARVIYYIQTNNKLNSTQDISCSLLGYSLQTNCSLSTDNTVNGFKQTVTVKEQVKGEMNVPAG